MRTYGKLDKIIQKLIKSHQYSTKPTLTNIRKSIYISKSTDIFTNLAIEDWFYKSFDFTNHHILLLWQNKPCVVIGRHQNPWLECNFFELPMITESGVQLARRNSGGGTVFHDLGNLNLTFFTSREFSNRKTNLELISQALNNRFNLNIQISPREDLVINEKKVSGTASKLGRKSAYHHCTLLVNANKENLSKALKNNIGDVKTNATRSVKSPIMNIGEINNEICVHKAMNIIANEYAPDAEKIYIDGEEILFPGFDGIKKQYLSYEWRFNKTPKFKVCRTIQISDNMVFEIQLEVEKGLACKVYCLNKNQESDKAGIDSDFEKLFNGLLGKQFSKDVLSEFEMIVNGLRHSEILSTGRL